VISVIFGSILLVAMNVGITPDSAFQVTDASGAVTTVNGYDHAFSALVPPAQIWIDAVGQSGGMIILFLVIGAQFFCGMSSVTANSRMIYAFSRDGAIPASKFWHRINPKTRTPTNSIWLAAVGAFILGLPYLWSPVAYFAITSIAVIGLYVAYIAPVYLRLRAGPRFKEGPWSLGRWSRPVGIVATIWVVFICIMFLLPQYLPQFDANGPVWADLNFTPIVFLVVLGGAGIWYAVSAKNWFKGPKVQGSPEELAAIERELEMAEA
jgi:amino acid transporter